MPVKKQRKLEIKEGEAVLKRIMGGSLVRNNDFLQLMDANGIKRKDKTWRKINSQVKDELKDGSIQANEVAERVNQLLLIESPTDRLITMDEMLDAKVQKSKGDIIKKGKIPVLIPYQSSGVGDVVIGSAVFGKSGAILGALNEGETKWNPTELRFIEDGFNIKSTGQVVLYKDVKKVVLGERGFVHTLATIITKSGQNFVYKITSVQASAFKSIIEDNIVEDAQMPVTENVQSSNNDELLFKYAELYEKGLLTKKEFEMKKEQLLNKNEVPAIELNEESSSNSENIDPIEIDVPKFCGNCGHPIASDSKFCSNCGNKIYQN